MSTSSSPTEQPAPDDDALAGPDVRPASAVAAEDQARASEALQASFARLAPQGSDEWNFMGAFTHLGDRYGPYKPGASELADLLQPEGEAARSRTGRRGRLRTGGQSSGAGEEKSEVEDAMAHVVEAFRFLHARVSTLEARLGAEDVPLDGSAWLAPTRELAGWVEPLTSLVIGRTPGGEILHADCGEGALIHALTRAGAPAYGVEPRGGVALRALESGNEVTICDADEHLKRRPNASLGGLVLNGVVDRLALRAIVPLLADCRRTLAPGAPIVVVFEPATPLLANAPASQDLVDRAALHVESWALLLDRSGFTDVAPLPTGTGGDERFAISAATPTT